MSALAQVRLRSVSSLADTLVAFVGALIDSAAKARAYRRTNKELSALSDRELHDLGVTRWEIAEVSRASVYGS